MSDTVFTKVDYNLEALMSQIALGTIGLPDIQRPFVWNNVKVRDLFDSMYRGYPVGYLLLWRNGLTDDKTIGTEEKEKTPSLVIVDGQQRLTSLFAVVRGQPVVRKNYNSERIQIAFNPLDGRFEVADAATRRDKSFIPDISRVWSEGLFDVARDYLEGLRFTREVNGDEERAIQDAITKLHNLLTFPFTALELAPEVDDEAVSNVFVRINSKGTPLNQADFILTLMSVFWDEGRTELEQFCRQARQPSKGVPSPFNHFIEPEPSQLLRVGVGVAFRRARLQHVYSLLRGKDLTTHEFSTERRDEQFRQLRDAQGRALNLKHWHDFMNCLHLAGFRSGRMISSNNNLLFSYMLYLIGRTEYGVEEAELRKTIAQWFFMSAVTGRFTGSPETAMDFDLAGLRGVSRAADFVRRLRHVCNITLTGDFWDVTLPNDLATSSPRSPSLFAYHAALVLLNAKPLFSRIRLADLLDPAISAAKGPVERHHLFPRAYLARLGITGTRETNQIANYAYLEWSDNAAAADQAPADYLPKLKGRFGPAELAVMYRHHALPEGWEHMDYHSFLERRRELIAGVIRDGYNLLATEVDPEPMPDPFDLTETISYGESDSTEFKSTLRINLHTGQSDTRIELAVLKTVAGFLNGRGGSLIVGVADDGTPVGIEADGFTNEDRMSQHLVNLVRDRISAGALPDIHPHFEDLDETRVLVVRCSPAGSPMHVKDGNEHRFYVRSGPTTQELPAPEALRYINSRFGG